MQRATPCLPCLCEGCRLHGGTGAGRGKEAQEEVTWVLAQIFLSDRYFAIYEVETCVETAELRCSCSGFKVKGVCAHTTFNRAQSLTDGAASLTFTEVVTTNELKVDRRQTMLHKSKVEVLV